MNEYLTIQERQSLKRRRLAVWLGTLVMVAGSIYGIYLLSQSDEGSVLGAAVTIQDHKRGPDAAKVQLVEYSDFQCPACRAYSPWVDQLSVEFGDQLQFVYRHYPLKTIHGNAVPAAVAAEAAGLQGKFWEMYRVLFDNQEKWATNRSANDLFANYAEELGMDINQFRQDIRSAELKGKVENDYNDGLKLGINSTPTFYLNGKKIGNPSSYDQFKELINAEINAK